MVGQIGQAVAFYTTEGLDRELRQSEIITGLRQYTYDPVANEGRETIHQFTILLTQDCDLLQDFNARLVSEPGELNGVLICEMQLTPDARTKISGSDIWKRIAQNKDERYQVLQGIPPEYDLLGIGLDDLVIDFKRYFTLPAAEIYRQFGVHGEQRAARRCRLDMPYREHLQSRAAYYLQRVGLPVQHKIAPLTR